MIAGIGGSSEDAERRMLAQSDQRRQNIKILKDKTENVHGAS